MIDDLEIETHPFEPFLPSNAKLLMMGSFPPPKNRWKMEFYYPNYQNDMWRIFGICFFQDKNYFLDLPNKNFQLELIQNFLKDTGIALFDTAYRISRLKGNASDKFLHIHTPTDLNRLLQQMPLCQYIMTTGDKATDTLMESMPEGTPKPVIGQSSQAIFAGRELQKKLAVEKKAELYCGLFKDVGLL